MLQHGTARPQASWTSYEGNCKGGISQFYPIHNTFQSWHFKFQVFSELKEYLNGHLTQMKRWLTVGSQYSAQSYQWLLPVNIFKLKLELNLKKFCPISFLSPSKNMSLPIVQTLVIFMIRVASVKLLILLIFNHIYLFEHCTVSFEHTVESFVLILTSFQIEANLNSTL